MYLPAEPHGPAGSAATPDGSASFENPIQPQPPPGIGGAVAPNQRAGDYTSEPAPDPAVAAEPPPRRAGPEPPSSVSPIRPAGVDPVAARSDYVRSRAAELAASLPAYESHGPTPTPDELTPPARDPDNPFGDFFGDGPSAWLEDEDEDGAAGLAPGEPRFAGTMLASGALAMLAAGWAVWGVAMYRGAGGAEAGGFVLIALLLWIWYLSMPRAQQHRFMLRWHERVRGRVEQRTVRLRARTEMQLSMRRERDRYRAMRDERSRRVAALGEDAYRAFRQGRLAPELQAGAQRVLAIERQMLMQDQHIHELERNRETR